MVPADGPELQSDPGFAVIRLRPNAFGHSASSKAIRPWNRAARKTKGHLMRPNLEFGRTLGWQSIGSRAQSELSEIWPSVHRWLSSCRQSSFLAYLSPIWTYPSGSVPEDLEENTRKLISTRHEEPITVCASKATEIRDSFAKERKQFLRELTIVQLDVDRDFYAIRDRQGRTLGTGGRDVCELLIQILSKQTSGAVSR